MSHAEIDTPPCPHPRKNPLFCDANQGKFGSAGKCSGPKYVHSYPLLFQLFEKKFPLGIKLPHDPAIPLLGICPEEVSK